MKYLKKIITKKNIFIEKSIELKLAYLDKLTVCIFSSLTRFAKSSQKRGEFGSVFENLSYFTRFGPETNLPRINIKSFCNNQNNRVGLVKPFFYL